LLLLLLLLHLWQSLQQLMQVQDLPVAAVLRLLWPQVLLLLLLLECC
jgi:hypothetical protein